LIEYVETDFGIIISRPGKIDTEIELHEK
jgi:hypothetical protein